MKLRIQQDSVAAVPKHAYVQRVQGRAAHLARYSSAKQLKEDQGQSRKLRSTEARLTA